MTEYAQVGLKNSLFLVTDNKLWDSTNLNILQFLWVTSLQKKNKFKFKETKNFPTSLTSVICIRKFKLVLSQSTFFRFLSINADNGHITKGAIIIWPKIHQIWMLPAALNFTYVLNGKGTFRSRLIL